MAKQSKFPVRFDGADVDLLTRVTGCLKKSAGEKDVTNSDTLRLALCLLADELGVPVAPHAVDGLREKVKRHLEATKA